MPDNDTEQGTEQSVKRGARHSAADVALLKSIRTKAQEIHQHAGDLGADDDGEDSEAESDKSIDATLVAYGGAVKALGDGKVGGYLVEFTNADDPDLDGEYFDGKTAYEIDEDEPRSRVYYQHGMDPTLGRRVIGKGTLRVDNVGVWIEAQLKLRDEYEKAIYGLAQAGKLGWSSGTASHLVGREPVGKAVHIISWPLGLDATLTPTPANPRPAARVIPLKSVDVSALPLSDLVSQVAGSQPETTPETKAADAEAIAPQDDVSHHSEVTPMSDNPITITKEDLAALVGDAVKSGVTEAMKALPAQPAPVATITDVHDNEVDKPWKSFGDQLMAVYRAGVPGGSVDKRFYATKASGLNETVPSDGGFLVQTDFAAELMRRTYELGQITRRCRKIPISAGSNGLKLNAIDETSRAAGSRYGGVITYWQDEAATKAATKPKFRQMELSLKKLTGLCYATDELLQDAAALEAVINQVFPEEAAFTVEDAIINGTGAGQPLGILNSPCLVTVNAEAGQLATTIVAENIIKMYSRMYTRNLANAVWLVNQDCLPQLHTMAIAVGAGGVPVYMPPNGLAGQPYATLYGLPVILAEYCQTLGTKGDIYFANFGEYVLIDKGGLQSAASIHVRFIYDETTFRFVYRVDGQPGWNAALTPAHGSATVSPFVALAAR